MRRLLVVLCTLGRSHDLVARKFERRATWYFRMGEFARAGSRDWGFGIRAAVVCVLCGGNVVLAQTEREDNWKQCRANDPDMRLPACSKLIDAGQATAAELASAYYARGNAYRQKSLFALALADFNAAIDANPALADAYGDRGITLTVLGRYADAIPDFTRVIESYPRLAYAHYNRGLCYELIGLDDLAIDDITVSIDIEPRAEFRFERRGTIYFRKNLLDKALADYEQALVINPQYAPALYGRGLIRIRKGDVAGGGADIALATHHRPNIAAEMARAGVK